MRRISFSSGNWFLYKGDLYDLLKLIVNNKVETDPGQTNDIILNRCMRFFTVSAKTQQGVSDSMLWLHKHARKRVKDHLKNL